MHPWLLQNPPISTYGAFILMALVVAWLWARARARRAHVEPSRVDLLIPLLLAAGLAGAWLFGVLTDVVTRQPVHSAVLVGSLLIATAAGIGYAWASGIRLGILGDVVAPPLALGIGIGRIGCFFAGCCFGKVCESPTVLTGVRFPAGSFAALLQAQTGQLAAGVNGSLPVYPVQLYESGACLLLAVLLWGWRRRDDRGVTGQKFLMLGIGYALIRFNLEFLRADNPPVGGLTFSQWGSIVMAGLAGITWVVRRRLRGCQARRREELMETVPGAQIARQG
ncbi:MAG TPA: prolipoprotein diacylglyceryl transferase family protein [Phycisphaerae bacterium]|jgi:phosphatidylglycerol:prolipoprotein diacylglycerol transferase